MFSIPAAPAKQSVGETITILSGRLSSATLLEDRRAAIQGLRSFSKDHPASVASGALRSLIGSLSKDGEDVDTVKVTLETLLMLFNPNPDSPEASDEIALWLADEFTQRQENITLLLDFLETKDYYSRIYSLQLLSAILSARTERTEECVFTAPLGISRLVAVLDDRSEPIRAEAISLLTYLTPTNPDIQKLVAFENAFERIFAIIRAEGGLLEGDRPVEDCLILMANLLRLNSSNQTHFRETGCVQELSRLLEGTYGPKTEGEEVATWAQQQGNRNVYALLAVIRLFLVPGALYTHQNQMSFWQHGVLHHALQLAFSRSAEIPIRAEALSTCADIIRGNPKLQESFAQQQVPSVIDDAPPTNGHSGGVVAVYVIDGLLDLTLSVSALQAFDLRLAACQCIKAYFHNHPEIRLHFLRRAIEGHSSGRDETANVLTMLLQPSNNAVPNDPYRHWFAAVILMHLIYENDEAKALAMAVTEGDAESGEEVVTSIQTITAHLISGLARPNAEPVADERITIGYLMLLITWLFEDLDGVNDFLGEGSNVQALAQAVQLGSNGQIVQGLCAILLGVLYEFSTKDSPIPRSTLHEVLISRMTRDKYMDALNKLRSHPFIRDFEVMPQKLDGSGNLPDVYFDTTFVEFFKDNYKRILRGIDRDPGYEVSVVTNGVEKGISRDTVDALRAQVEEKESALQTALTGKTTLEQQLGQEQADHRRSKESLAAEIARIKAVNDGLQRNHQEELQQQHAQQRAREETHKRELEAARREAQAAIEGIRAEQRSQEEAHKQETEAIRREGQKAAEALRAEQTSKEAELQRQLDYVKKTAEAESARLQRRAEAEMADLRATISRLEVDLMKVTKAKSQEIQALRDEQADKVKTMQDEHATKLASATSRATAEAAKAKKAEERAADLEKQIADFEKHTSDLEKDMADLEKEKEDLEKEKADLEKQVADLEKQMADPKKHKSVSGKQTTESDDKIKKVQAELKEKEQERAAAQTELDDLLMVFGDVEEKAKKYKKRLRALGETVTDDEDDEDEEDEDDEEEEEEEEDANGVD